MTPHIAANATKGQPLMKYKKIQRRLEKRRNDYDAAFEKMMERGSARPGQYHRPGSLRKKG